MSEPEKKKRRQNVACDTCRLRRVKCDMLTLLAGDATGPTPPLHVLVAENPGVSCSNCINKGIKCTTNQIVNPAKPNKGGRRIEHARRVYGSDGSVSMPPGTSFPIVQNTAALPAQSSTQLGLGDFLAPGPSASMVSSGRASPAATDLGWTAPFDLQFHPPAAASDVTGAYPPTWDHLLPGMGLDASTSPVDGSIPGIPGFPTPHLPTTGPSVDHLLPTDPAQQAPSPGWTSADALTLHDPTAAAAYFQEQLMRLMQGAVAGPSRKRGLDDDDDEERDKWALWVPSSKQDVHWSRREAVGEQLADRALGRELSRHLVEVYFQSVHLMLPTVSPEVFYMDWQRAGQRSDRMAPDQETLCAVIEAWAARFSDHPVVLGLEKSMHHTSPKVITDTGTFVPGGVARSYWGRARLKVCAALMERARRLIDTHHILIKPSITGLQALCMYNQLLHMSDMQPQGDERFMEERMMHTILVEQMKTLDLTWNPAGELSINPTLGRTGDVLLRIRQRRLFWTIIVSDAFWAAATGNEPKISDEDVDGSGEWLATVEDTDLNPSFRMLSFFMRAYHRCAIIGRTIARKLSVPARRPGAVDVGEFCGRVRTIWRDIRTLYTDLSKTGAELLEQCEEDLLGFSPIHFLASIRNGCSFLLLTIHMTIDGLVGFRKGLHEAYLSSETSTPDSHSSPGQNRAKMLDELRQQSVDIGLSHTRAQLLLCKALLPTGLLQSGSMMLRVLLSLIQFLAEVPTNEQGYPSNTAGGNGWTWDVKQKEVATCEEALHQLGWGWADIGPVLDKVHLIMERMQPTAEQLAQYAATFVSPESDPVAIQRQKDLNIDEAATQAALKFWPPPSVAQAVSRWSRAMVASSTSQSTLPTSSIHALSPRSSNSGSSSPGEEAGSGQSWRGFSGAYHAPQTGSNTGGNAPGPIPTVTVTPSDSATEIPSGRRARDVDEVLRAAYEGAAPASEPQTPRRVIGTPNEVWNMGEPPLDAAVRAARSGMPFAAASPYSNPNPNAPNAYRDEPEAGPSSAPNLANATQADLAAELESFIQQLTGEGLQ